MKYGPIDEPSLTSASTRLRAAPSDMASSSQNDRVESPARPPANAAMQMRPTTSRCLTRSCSDVRSATVILVPTLQPSSRGRGHFRDLGPWLVVGCQGGLVRNRVKRPRQDSNLRTRLRRPMLYPLSYEGGVCNPRSGRRPAQLSPTPPNAQR